MNEFVNTLYKELKLDIATYSELGQPIASRLGAALKAMHQIILRLRSHILETGFPDETTEIDFFKHHKPKFVAEQIYLTELTGILLLRPGLDTELLKIHYENELQQIRLYFNRYGFLYQCYLIGATDLDNVLFTRYTGPTGMILPELTATDPDFNTNGDHLWAKFIAYERLAGWLQNEIRKLENPNDNSAPEIPTLRWTGEAINLVELAYGIWLTGQLNHGNATITDIIRWLEHHLAVHIGTPNARWTQIAARKHIPPTKYTDQIRQALLDRIDNELTQQNPKRKARRMN